MMGGRRAGILFPEISDLIPWVLEDSKGTVLGS